MRRTACFMMVSAAVCGVAFADTVTLTPAVPEAGQNLTVSYDPTCTPLEGEETVIIRYGFNGFINQAEALVTSNGLVDTPPYDVVIPVAAQATVVNFVFKNEGETFDNNDGADYNFDTINGVPNSPRVSASPVADMPVTVTYTPAGGPLQGHQPIYMHYGFNGFNPTINPDVLMTTNGVGGFEATVSVKSYAATMDMVFNNSGDGGIPGTITDNNDNFDWHLAVSGTVPRIAVSPNPPVATQPCTITYNAEDTIFDGSSNGFRKIHWGINSFPAPFGADIEMTSNGQVWTGVIPEVPLRAEVLAFVIHDSPGAIGDAGVLVDNNNGQDYRFDTVGAKPLTNELDALYVAKTPGLLGPGFDGLNIGIAGNLVDDSSSFVIFIDTPGTVGQTELMADGAATPPDGLPFASRQNDAIQCETFSEGTILPGEADYALVVNRSGNEIFFNQYFLSGSPLAGEEITCCTGGTLDTFASQIFAGATNVNDGNDLFETDQALFYFGGFDDSDTNGMPGAGNTGLEIIIPYLNIGVPPQNLMNNQDFSVFVALMPSAPGLLGQFSNQMLPPNTGDLCSPGEVLPLRSDLSQFGSVWTGNTGSLPSFGGVADGVIVASDYNGTPDAAQTCDRPEYVPDPAVTIEGNVLHGETVTIVYTSTNGPLDGASSIDMLVSFDEFVTSNSIAMTADVCAEDQWTADLFIESNGLPLLLSMRFNGDTGADDNTGQLWEFGIERAPRGETVVINPFPVQAGEPLVVTYDPVGRPIEGGEGISAHYGFNNWSVGITDKKMVQQADCTWEMTIDASPLAAGSNGFDVVFFDTNGTYDNNDGNDWHFKATGGVVIPWTMDGDLDCCSTLVGTSQNGTRHLYAGLKDGWVYVATESPNTTAATEDHFIFISDELPASQTGQPWAKAGTVGAFDAYLAREQSNDFVGWFNIAGTTVTNPQTNNAQWLEGSFNLAEELPSATTTLWIAHGAWGNNNGDPLNPATQVPATLDDNGNIEAAEYLELVLSTVAAPTTFDPFDFTQDCEVGEADYQLFEDCLAGPGVPIPGGCVVESVADTDADLDVDLVDFAAFLESVTTCP